MRFKYLSCLFSFLLVCHFTQAQNYIFGQFNGTPVNLNGWYLTGNAHVGNTPVGSGNEEVILTDPSNFQSGGVFFATPINITLCDKWFAEFDFRLFDGSSADGITFCLLDNPPVGAVAGVGLGLPPNANGLKICFDTWKNCGNDAIPKIEIRYTTTYDECASQPTANNNSGNLTFIRSSTYNHCKVAYNAGNIDVYVNGTLYLSGFQTFGNLQGYFGFTGSTGGSNDRQSIKNAIIYTQRPPSVAGGPSVTFCPKDALQIGTVNNPNYNYSWSPTFGLDNPNISNPTVSLDNIGINSFTQTYYVYTSLATSPNCQSIDSIKVIVKPKPKVDFGTSRGCLPNAFIQFSDSTKIGDGLPQIFTYNWDFGDPSGSNLSNPNTDTTKNPNHIYIGNGPYSVHLSAISQQGCYADTVKILNTIIPKPIANFPIISPICLRDSIHFFDQSTASNAVVTNWFWSFGDNTFSTLPNPVHLYANAGNYLVKFVIMNDAGCVSDTFFRTVTINPLPTANFITSLPNCENQTITFTNQSLANSGNIVSWNWNLGDGTSQTFANGNPFTQTYINAGNYTVSLVVSTDKGCKSDTLLKNILVNAQPVPSFILPEVCLADAFAQFTDSSFMVDGSNGSFTYSWNFGDALATPLSTNFSTLKNPKHRYSAVGVYNVTLTVTTNKGCIKTKVLPLTVNGDIPISNFNVLNSNNLCANSRVKIQNTSKVNFGSITKIIVYWDWANNPAIKDSDDVASPNFVYSHQYPDFQAPAFKTYKIRMLAYSGGTCLDDTIQTITLNASPKVQFLPIPNVCLDKPPVQINQASATGPAGSFVFSGNGVSPSGILSPSGAGAGSHTILATYITNAGCRDSASSIVTIYPSPQINAGPNLTVLEGGQVQIQSTVSGSSNYSFLWSPPHWLSNDTILAPLVIDPKNDETYQITVTALGGCQATSSVFVKLLLAPVIPNVFSPNGDGINDVWNIKYLDSYPGTTIEIFDRYGRLIFTSTGYSKPWDGKLNGNNLPVGVYYYVIDPKNGRKVMTGSVTILR